MSRPLKLFRVSTYSLPVPPEHRACNGSAQVSVAIRCTTKTRFAQILASIYRPADKRDTDRVLRHLRAYGCRGEYTANVNGFEAADAAVVKPETIYYNPEHHTPKLGYVNQWFELSPRS